jgi:hypothetical protein
VLSLLDRPWPGANWFELYKVYEIILHSRLLTAAQQASGVTAAEVKLFKRTANHHRASGVDSRHARSTEQPPAKPMTLPEARPIFRRLVSAWIRLLAGQAPLN